MKKKKIIRWLAITVLGSIIIGGGTILYIWNMPHRDVQASNTDYTLQASRIVNEYLADAEKANEKYLDEEGDSKILEVTGKVSEISEDYNNNKVVLLKSDSDKTGVSCTFTPQTNSNANKIQIGATVTIKGVIRSGASYDKDLGMYENVIIEKCDLISK